MDTQLPENIVVEQCPDREYAIDMLCINCAWQGHFEDGSTDHAFNHKCS